MMVMAKEGQRMCGRGFDDIRKRLQGFWLLDLGLVVLGHVGTQAHLPKSKGGDGAGPKRKNKKDETFLLLIHGCR